MSLFTRRKFVKSASLLLAAPMIPGNFFNKKDELLLSFSTLGCPDWGFGKIVDFAMLHQYQGIEMRGILREMDLTKCREFISPRNIGLTMTIMKDRGLRFVDLGSSANLQIADSTERKLNLDEAKRFIDLAQKLECPFIRVFPNNFVKGTAKETSVSLITQGLQELGSFAKDSNVSVLMETHGDLVHTDDLQQIMSMAGNEHTGLVWDIANMWTVTRQPPAEVYDRLRTYIRHVHVKDAFVNGDTIRYTLLGRGDVPVFEAIDLLRSNNYKGFYSFEWEKLWHPEIEEPEIALADYPEAMKKHVESSN